MPATILRTAAIALALGWCMPALGQVNLGFFNNSALGELTEQDAVLLRDALQSALKSEAAGGVFDWANPASGAKGTVRVRQAYQSQGAPCRVLEIATTAHYKTFRDTYDVCRDQNGAWAPTGG